MVDNELVVAVVALLVSVTALLATFMQVLQQYYASAAGYLQCNEKVMGEWAKSKSRKFLWDELRYEVQFDSPVIFVSPPTNDRGPVPEADIFFLKGTKKSLEETGTNIEDDVRKEYIKRSRQERIHTADNERASWLVLLLAVQKMEATSREWQERQYKYLGPPGYGLPNVPPSLEEHHTLTVALQRKRKSWDTMPRAITKPYGTTTMCHLIEMMAALGVYWKEFDRKRDRYRAEGNGFMVLGEKFTDLGLMFSFQVYGKCVFEANRVIPVDEVKELCFGYVPTIYREILDHSRLDSPHSEIHSLGTLQMASRSEISETLAAIGCTTNAAQTFLSPGSRIRHLFPLSFEILGMLGRTIHIQHSSFTHIPNPTSDRWDKRSFSLVKVMESYRVLSEYQLPHVPRNAIIYSKITHHITKILSHQEEGSTSHRLLYLTALHNALEDCDEILTAKSAKDGEFTAASDLRQQQPNEHMQTHRREIVQDVLRNHIQEVLRLLNEREERHAEGQSLHVPEMTSASPRTSRYRDRSLLPRFEDVDSCGPDEKQHRFMEVYFEVIRKHVVQSAAQTTERRASITGGTNNSALRRDGSFVSRSSIAVKSDLGAEDEEDVALSIHTPRAENAIAQPVSSRREVTEMATAAGPLLADARRSSSTSNKMSIHLKGTVHSLSLAAESVSHDDVWCTLVFRMICWLMLHDFNKLDIQMSKSELLGSRMPVYIA